MAPAQTKFVALLAISILGFVSDASAVRVENLYAAEVPFDGARSPQAAFPAALAQVLVKITGRPDVTADDGRFPDAGRFVQQYRIGGDGNVWVLFDEVALRRELDRLGEPVWGSERPTTLAWMILDDGFGERRILVGTPDVAETGPERGSAGASELAESGAPSARPDGATDGDIVAELQLAADARGLPLLLPLGDTLEMETISLRDVWGGFVESIEDASSRYNADAVLVGRVRPAAFETPRVRWTLLVDEERYDWESDVVGGANDVADFFAARLSASAGTANRIVLSVEGVDGLDAYGRLSAYLGRLDLVEDIAVDTVLGDSVVFSLQVRGDVDRLMRSIALQRVLQPVEVPTDPDDPLALKAKSQRLHYRLIAGS